MNSYDKFYRYIYLLIDIFLILVSFHLGHVFRGLSYNQTLHDQVLVLYSIISWFVIIKITHFDRIFINHKERIVHFVKSIAVFGLMVTTLGFLFKGARYSRLLTAYYLISYTVLDYSIHHLIDTVIINWNRNHFRKNVLIIGAGRMGRKILSEIHKHPEMGYQLVGFLEDKPKTDTPEIDKHIIGKLSELERIIRTVKVDEIIIALPLSFEETIGKIIATAEEYGIRLRLIPDIYRLTVQKIELSNIGNVPVFQFSAIPLDDPFNRLIKRAFDILFAGTVLILFSPVIVFAAIAVKMSSKGPVFFVQLRTGYNQNNFKCYKIRSMKVMPQSIQDTLQATADDPRKTKIGDFLRRTNIDELPQFWNVLKGEMSVVGPRPHMLNHTKEFNQRVDKYLIRHFIKPGITGWAQVNGWRGPTDTDEKLKKRIEYDLWYMENWSLWLDIKIIFKTIFSKQSRLNAF